MSHIDSFKHELVGYISWVPVYHPLEDIDGDFVCTTKQIVIGGGSGEHPAMVLESPLKAVALFLLKLAEKEKRFMFWKDLVAPYLPETFEEVVTFYEWTDVTYADFFKLLSSDGVFNAMGEENQLEHLILGLGEFIFYAMPELAVAVLDKVKQPYKDIFHIYYNSILIVPPNMPVYPNGGNMFFKKK
ncbi:hypothetical protein [Neptunitalea lumnitzerae]|uniref:Uncharacterized protein n=1 Tax=Neptunitalea lumnitzerae TaxID=2965509 RepID=A0ABQ5MM78_9FLAO|nr:hypothetical protein [Neptunitalea sp. Y10]GLB50518.1 hypothetical protein Y10_28860 [Neptunitalea sp. Y10]